MENLKMKEIWPELDIFSWPRLHADYASTETVPYYPTSTYQDNDHPLIFSIEGSEKYIDLHNSMLYVRAHLTMKNGSNLPADEKVAPGNLFFPYLI